MAPNKNDLEIEANGPFAADVPTRNSGSISAKMPSVEAETKTSSGFLNFMSTAIQNPFVTVNFAILLALATLALIYNGGGLISTFTKGEPIAIGMVLAAQLVVLGCSVAAATLSTKAKIDQLEEAARSDGVRLEIIARQNQHLREALCEIGEHLRARLSEGVVRLRDTPAFWRSVVKDGNVIAIQPGSRTEVSEKKGSDGKDRFQISREGIVTTIKRYGQFTGIARANIVFVQPKSKVRQEIACSEMLRMIALYKSSDTVIRNSGFTSGLDFDGVSVHIVCREDMETTSNFILDAKLAAEDARKLLVRYETSTDPLAPVFGRTLEVVTEPSEIDAALINADRLIKSAERTMSISQLLARHEAELPECDVDLTALTEDERAAIGLPIREFRPSVVRDFIDFGDGSFRI